MISCYIFITLWDVEGPNVSYVVKEWLQPNHPESYLADYKFIQMSIFILIYLLVVV